MKNIFSICAALMLAFLPGAASAISLSDAASVAFGQFESFKTLIFMMSYMLGAGLAVWGVYALKLNGDTPSRYKMSSIILALLAGSAMLSFPSTVEMMSESVFGDDLEILAIADVKSLQGTSVFGKTIDANVMKAVVGFVVILGYLAILKGLYVLYQMGREVQGAGVGKALAHIGGGVMAVNLFKTGCMLTSTFGSSTLCT